MIYIKLFIVVIGAAMAANGWEELQLGEGASAEAQLTELATLESGQWPADRHLQIGEHWRLYDQLVYSYELKTGQELNDSTRLTHVYYPVISLDHGVIREIGQLAELYNGAENIPDEQMPELEKYAMLVKSEAFSTFGSLPEPTWQPGEPIHGMMVNGFDSFSSEEQQLLQESFPNLILGSVVILEEGRTPTPVSTAYGLMGGGGLMALAGVASFFMGGGRDPSESEPEPVQHEEPMESPHGTGPAPIA
ncbi:MAG: hypothetical protein MJE66_12995 [Proteobacteria bacterium]|nr:hypothetical protein [Pseudomonadota bacterium]